MAPQRPTPTGGWQVGGHQSGAALVTLAEHLEQQFGAGFTERNKAEFVDDQQAVFSQLLLEAQQAFLVSGLHQLVNQGGGRGEAHREPLLAGCQTKAESDMGLAGAAVAERDDVLAAVIQEAYIKGVSTRSVDDLVQAMGMSGISKSQVSRLCGEIDDKVNGFLDRSLEGDWPYLWLDATYVKVREAGRIVSVAVTVAVAVNDQGRREVLGMAIGASEAEAFWTEFLRSLVRRGLRGVKLLISDDHKGLKAAATRILGATWQRCRVHFARNLLAHAGRQGRRVVSAFVATAFAQEDADSAKAQWRQVADQLRPKVPKLAVLMDEAEHDVLAYMTFPKEHRQKLHSTNPIERLHAEVKRRTNVVGIVPNEAAITRLVGAILLEQNDEWAVSRRYMTLESIAPLSDGVPITLPTVAA